MPADPLRWKALTIVCAAFFMTVLDVSIVNVALPSIGRALHFSRDNLQWVITAYAITFGGFLLLGGACSSSAWSCSRSRRSSAAWPGRRAF
jgi:MFS family permease